VTDDLYSYNIGVQCDGALHNNTPRVNCRRHKSTRLS